jgi:tight adherence protein C
MIYFLWMGTAILFLLVIQERVGHPRWLFPRMFAFLPVKRKQISVLKKITGSLSFKKHSWLVQQSSPKSVIRKQLQNAGDLILYSEYLNIKEGVLRLFSLFLFLFLLFGNPTWEKSFLFLFYFCFFFFLLDIVLQIKKEKREKIFTHEVPYFIDLFILTLRTGLNIEQTLWCLTEKDSLLSRTIHRQLEGLNLGRSLEEIFVDLEEDVGNKEFQHFLRSVRQSQALGVSLAYTLEIQSQLIRTKRKQRAEELSRTAAVKISLPLVLFIFPALLIIYIGPGILNIL